MAMLKRDAKKESAFERKLKEIEREKRNKLSEDIEIKSDLSIEHIMPQAWSENS